MGGEEGHEVVFGIVTDLAWVLAAFASISIALLGEA